MSKGEFFETFVPFFLLRSCFSWRVVPGVSPLGWEGLVVDLKFFRDGRHQGVASGGVLVDTEHSTNVAQGGDAG